MDGCDLRYSNLTAAFHCTNPYMQVGHWRVFNKYGDVSSAQCLGYFLNSKRAGRGAGTNPHGIDTVV